MAEVFVFWRCPRCKHVEVVHEDVCAMSHKHEGQVVQLILLKQGVYGNESRLD